jgi:hypothetical protein
MECPKNVLPMTKESGMLEEQNEQDPGLDFSRKQLSKVINAKGIDKAEKSILYNQALLRYRQMRKKKAAEPVHMLMSGNRTDWDNGAEDNFTEEDLRRGFSLGSRVNGRRSGGDGKHIGKRPAKGIFIPRPVILRQISKKHPTRLKPTLWK